MSRLGATGYLIAATPLSLFAQTQTVSGFDDNGWNADDVRNSTGTNVTNSTTHNPGAGSISDPSEVAARLQWVNNLKTFGNLGGLRFDSTNAAGGKTTLSTVSASFGVLGTLVNAPGFSVNYVWSRDANVTPGLSFRMGVQTSSFNAAQTSYTATRSGESGWDLVLVYDPTNNGNNTGTRPSVSAIDPANGKFNLFAQAGNTYWSTTAGAEATKLGVGLEKSRTLAEWLADSYWGPILTAANITNTQFGMGSGNADGVTTLDWAELSFINSGNPVHFVADGTGRYTGGGSDPAAFADAANWDGVTPSGTTNLVVEAGADLTVSGSQSARSLGGLGGVTNLTLAPGSVLTLNPAENGTLSAFVDATVNVTGDGTLQAGVIEASGTVNLAVETTLDGGATPHPVRDGTNPLATSRYGIVVLGGGVVTLQNGANVTVSQESKNVGVRVGEGAGTGTLNIEAGSSLVIGNETAFSTYGLTSNGFLVVGDFGSTGIVNQTGGQVRVIDGSFNLGNQGGFGTYNLSDGTLSLEGGLHSLGRNTGSNAAGSGTVNLSGGLLEIKSSANNGNASFIIGDREDSVTDGTGTLNQTGGVLRVAGNSNLFLGGHGSSTYNLTGGTLEIGGSSLRGLYQPGMGSYAFNLGGGTIRVVGSDLTTSVNMQVVDLDPGAGATASFVDTNGLNATFTGNLGGTGTLVKTGVGILTLTGADNAVGALASYGGTLRQSAGTTTTGGLFAGSYGSNTNGIVELTGGTMNVFSGSVAIGSGAGNNTGELRVGGSSVLNIGDANNPGVRVDMYVGAFNGASATLTQTGGTVNLNSTSGVLHVGNQAEGTYDLSGGTLNINRNAMILGRSTINGTGAGTFNISGGAVNFANGTYLSVGGVDGDASNLVGVGSGSVNQTGGVVTFNGNAYLSVGTKGAGAYNLDGGELRIGGANGIRTFQGAGALNLGGGKLTVVGSNLTTSVFTGLTADTTSTIDTNGFDAGFGSILVGPGNLAKIGEGTLTVSIADVGAFSAQAGASVFTQASTFDSISVSSGATFSALGGLTLDGGSITLGFTDLSNYASLTLGGDIDLTGTLNIDLVAPFSFVEGNTLQVFNYVLPEFIDFTSLTIGTLPTLDEGLYWDDSALASSGTITVAAVPEPASFAALAGLGVLAFAAARRRARA